MTSPLSVLILVVRLSGRCLLGGGARRVWSGASGIDVSGAAAGPGALLWLPESPLSRAEANTSNQSPPAPRAISAVRHTTEQSKCKQRPAAGRSRRRAWPSQQHHPDRRRQAGHPASGCLCSAARRMPPRSARTPRTPRKRPRSRTSTTSRRCLARKYHTARTLRTPSVSTVGRECHWRTAAHSWDTRTPDINSFGAGNFFASRSTLFAFVLIFGEHTQIFIS